MDRERLILELRKSERMSRMLRNCHRAIIRSKDENDLLNSVCDIIVAVGGYTLCWVAFANHDEKKSVVPVAQSGLEESYLKSLDIRWSDTDLGRGPTGTALRKGIPSIVNNIIGDSKYRPWSAEATKRGFSSSAAIPLISGGEIIGALNVYSSDPNAFDLKEMELLQDLSDDMAHGLIALRTVEREKATTEERDRLATAIEQSTEMVVITDGKGVIEYVNPAFERVTGYSREEVFGENPRILKSDRHDPSFYRSLWDTITAGQVWRGSLINRKKNGAIYEEECVISSIKDQSGRIDGYVAVKRDVTNQKLLEKKIRHTQKLNAIGTLAGGIAHDFNNTLMPVIGYAELLQNSENLTEKGQKRVEEIHKAAIRAKELIRRILTFSRKGEQSFRPVEPYIAIKEALKLLRSSLPSTVKIVEAIDSGSGSFMGDLAQTHQIIVNLCANAAYAMRKNGGILRVELIAERPDKETRQRYRSLHDIDYITLTVSDTGVGIGKDIIDRIFEPFFTTKHEGESSGMGLSVVHGIVEDHDGLVTVESEPGKGSVFKVYLPKLTVKKGEEKSYEKKVFPRGKENVLVIDDDETVATTIEIMLENLGYKVKAFTRGKKALELFLEDPSAFDIVVTDSIMPEINGEELARQVNSIRKDLPIILITGLSHESSAGRKKPPGVRKIIYKPFSPSEISNVIRNVIDHRK